MKENPKAPTGADTFLSVFSAIVAKLLGPDTFAPVKAILAAVTVRDGFPRGAAYTLHKTADKHANASAACEPTPEGRDWLINPMEGMRPADVVGRFLWDVAESLYPSRAKEGGSGKAKDHRTKERKAFLEACKVSRDSGGWAIKDDTTWEPLLPHFPPIRYKGSKEPSNPNMMVAFSIMGADGKPSKQNVYLSLKVDGSDAGYVAKLLRDGIKVSGPRKPLGKGVHASYYPAPVKAEEKTDEKTKAA